MTLWAVVPAKALDAAKGRLAPLLAPAERRALAAAFLADVLAALRAAPSVERVLVVSADPAALALAEAQGATPLREPCEAVPPPEAQPAECRAAPAAGDAAEARLNAALDHAAATAAAAGATALLMLPADLPLATPADVAALVAAPPPAPSVVLAAAPDGGTTALLRQPPLAVPACFGPASLRAHLRAAAARRVAARLVWRPNLTVDVDRPADLLRLAALAPRSRAQALLAEWRVRERWRGGGGSWR